MRKLKDIFFLILLTFLVSTTNITFAVGDTNTPAKRDWPFTIGKIIIGSVFSALVLVATNPEIVKIILKYFNKKYAQEIQLEQLRTINESLRTQLDYLRINCKDNNLIKAVEDEYLKSCIQVMELQKKYFEKYANQI